ncbi:hypothetical protein IMG5_147650 [Ichthyophthirius multifiliis]|uniref:FAD-binding PCMH-type domain-containing protein n=1 Tax=Ichthyophthirius multifiliis TaxID=5932 RepID=G0QY62_ICHMU|nr:hypothetical protein IMG5_147650 [Ichthyophthirius multifiliis]EGR29836.1 hypothetical protein IMG5_147650 [Ichthyophthirius multifiliis]|eukprot:XP_004031072.1 hypothetical protein IMG5_147650 [Ichthyophthirius multifiliis]
MFNVDWNKNFKGETPLVLLPKTTEQISQIMKYCNEQKIAVVPQGGNTGLVGGSVSVHDEICISLSKMNQIINFDEQNSTLSVESGCILEQLNNFLKPHNYEISIDLAAKGSCQIGGLLSTHAGGIRLIKYGPLRGHILGLEVVLANGEILNLRNCNRKDNTGIDLKQLFVGSEGILGIITKADINICKVDQLKSLLVIKCENFNDVLTVKQQAKQILGKDLAALEYLDQITYDIVLKDSCGRIQDPFQNNNSFNNHYILVEIQCNHDIQYLSQLFFDSLISQNFNIDNIVMSQNETQYQQLWSIRENVAEAAAHLGTLVAYDISVNPDKFHYISKLMRDRCQNIAITTSCGHIGDGNLHLMFAAFDQKCVEVLEKEHEMFLYNWVKENNGSISAEHGIGLQKKNYLNIYKDSIQMDYMRQLKQIFDPNFIINPYKII